MPSLARAILSVFITKECVLHSSARETLVHIQYPCRCVKPHHESETARARERERQWRHWETESVRVQKSRASGNVVTRHGPGVVSGLGFRYLVMCIPHRPMDSRVCTCVRVRVRAWIHVYACGGERGREQVRGRAEGTRGTPGRPSREEWEEEREGEREYQRGPSSLDD